MSDLDKPAYEQQQSAERRQVAATLLGSPWFAAALDEWGRGPVVMLLCARGHKLLQVRGEVIGDEIHVFPLPGVARRPGRVTSHGEPWRRGKRVCRTFGCPVLVAGDGYCKDHGGDIESVGSIRTVFACRRNNCSWVGPVTTARLLQLYGVAVRLDRRDIALG